MKSTSCCISCCCCCDCCSSAKTHLTTHTRRRHVLQAQLQNVLHVRRNEGEEFVAGWPKRWMQTQEPLHARTGSLLVNTSADASLVSVTPLRSQHAPCFRFSAALRPQKPSGLIIRPRTATSTFTQLLISEHAPRSLHTRRPTLLDKRIQAQGVVSTTK